MRSEDILKGLLIFLMMALWVTIGFGIYGIWDQDFGITETECYDRYGNEIIGLICEEEYTKSEAILVTTIVILFSMLGTAMFFILLQNPIGGYY